MALVLADRVQETTTTTGTGTVTLSGAVSGFQSFSAIGNGNTTYYTIADQTGTNWEVGLGTYTASGTTLSRDSVLSSSNSGSLVNFGAGTKNVFVTYPASKAVYNGGALGTPSSGTLTSATGLPISTGVSGLGTNVATALGTAVGSAGAFVVNGGALGTPSSGTATNLTGLPLSTGVTGQLAIANGGTGQSTQTAAFDALAPTTTKGDLIVSDGGDNIRLAVGTNNYVLTADSAQTAGVKWAAVPSASPGGSDTQVQFNDSGSFGGDAGLTYNKTTNTLSTDVYVASAGTASAPSITTTGDTNTGVYFPGADSVAITTGGTAAVTVDSGQRTKFPTTIGIGNATPSTSGAGITFPATQSASTDANTLDDYEEGTFTPTIFGSSSAGTGTYSAQSGYYTKIGNRVCVDILMTWSAHTGTGNMRIGSLPFTSNASQTSVLVNWVEGITLTANNLVVLQNNGNSTSINFYQTPTGGGNLTDVAMDGSGLVRASGVYFV